MKMLVGKGDSIKNEIEQDKIESMYEVACYNELYQATLKIASYEIIYKYLQLQLSSLP